MISLCRYVVLYFVRYFFMFTVSLFCISLVRSLFLYIFIYLVMS